MRRKDPLQGWLFGVPDRPGYDQLGGHYPALSPKSHVPKYLGHETGAWGH
jgi:hypothetical protein